jgi:hypothetical protein
LLDSFSFPSDQLPSLILWSPLVSFSLLAISIDRAVVTDAVSHVEIAFVTHHIPYGGVVLDGRCEIRHPIFVPLELIPQLLNCRFGGYKNPHGPPRLAQCSLSSLSLLCTLGYPLLLAAHSARILPDT